MSPMIRVAMTATKAPWGTAFRAFVRDHASGVVVETLMSPSQLPGSGQDALDVLIIDDQMPVVKSSHICVAKERGTHVIGLWDETAGRGRDYVIELGVDEALPASATPAELLHAVLRVGHAISFGSEDVSPGTCHGAHVPSRTLSEVDGTPRRGRRAVVTSITAVSGGTGLTETLISIAEHLSARERVLVVEAASATLAQRLRRAPEYGLAWSLDRMAAGQAVFPDALSPGRGDGTQPLGQFDVICGTAAPAGPPPISPTRLGRLVDLAADTYDHVLVETGPLSAHPAVPGGDRFAAAKATFSRANRVIVFAAPDPCGATKLIDWLSVAYRELELTLPMIAVFGRAPRRRFERAALLDVLRRNTARPGFDAIRFLPEDTSVGRARWNSEMVVKGPWKREVTALTADLKRSAHTNHRRSTDIVPANRHKPITSRQREQAAR